MNFTVRDLALGATLALASTLAACGGGGSGSGGSPTVLPSTSATATPTPSATATATPTPTATPTLVPVSTPPPTTAPTTSPTVAPASVVVSGTVVDYTAGTGVSGATVALSPQNATLNPTTIATTASDGTFSGTFTSSGPYVLVVSSSGRPTLHENVTIAAGTNAVGTLKLVTLTTEDLSEISLINSDRAAHGNAPAVTPDEFAMEVARFHAMDMAGNTGLGGIYYGHADRNGLSPQQRYANAGGIGGDSETICTNNLGSGFAQCEAEYIAEGPPPAGQANHYSIIVNPAQVWVGVGSSTAAAINYYQTPVYYDEEYIQYPY